VLTVGQICRSPKPSPTQTAAWGASSGFPFLAFRWHPLLMNSFFLKDVDTISFHLPQPHRHRTLYLTHQRDTRSLEIPPFPLPTPWISKSPCYVVLTSFLHSSVLHIAIVLVGWLSYILCFRRYIQVLIWVEIHVRLVNDSLDERPTVDTSAWNARIKTGRTTWIFQSSG